MGYFTPGFIHPRFGGLGHIGGGGIFEGMGQRLAHRWSWGLERDLGFAGQQVTRSAIFGVANPLSAGVYNTTANATARLFDHEHHGRRSRRSRDYDDGHEYSGTSTNSLSELLFGGNHPVYSQEAATAGSTPPAPNLVSYEDFLSRKDKENKARKEQLNKELIPAQGEGDKSKVAVIQEKITALGLVDDRALLTEYLGTEDAKKILGEEKVRDLKDRADKAPIGEIPQLTQIALDDTKSYSDSVIAEAATPKAGKFTISQEQREEAARKLANAIDGTGIGRRNGIITEREVQRFCRRNDFDVSEAVEILKQGGVEIGGGGQSASFAGNYPKAGKVHHI